MHSSYEDMSAAGLQT